MIILLLVDVTTKLDRSMTLKIGTKSSRNGYELGSRLPVEWIINGVVKFTSLWITWHLSGNLTHRINLACGEPNVIDVAMRTRPGQTDFSAGRLAVWGTYTTTQGQEECLNLAQPIKMVMDARPSFRNSKLQNGPTKPRFQTVPTALNGLQILLKKSTYARDCPDPNE
jgi:hypothetical protein